MFKPFQVPTTKSLPSTDGLNVNELEDVITIQTGTGYTKLRCEPSTTIKDMIAILMRTVSQSNSTKHYGLELTEKTPNDGSFRHILCPSLTWTETKSKYNPKCLSLTICYYPTNFEEIAQSDPVTLAYLHQQVRDWYLLRFRDIEHVDLAFEIGCFEICMVTQNSTLSAKDRLELFERARPLQTLFPPCVLQHYKCKALRRAMQNYLSQIYAMSQEDWTLELLNRYLILLQFDREMIPCRFGAGYGIPAELVIGPRVQISINVEHGKEPRLLAHFASIHQILVSKSRLPIGERFNVRLVIHRICGAQQKPEIISLAFHSLEAADTCVHLLELYCTDERLRTEGVSVPVDDAKTLLPNGCPYRLIEDMNAMEINREDLKLERVLGDGQYGDVYMGLHRKYPGAEPTRVAIKTCKIECLAKERQEFMEEAMILREFDHPHIVRLLGVCLTDPMWLVMEYAPLGELRQYLLATQQQMLLSTKLTFCYQIVTALVCLENKRCVHRDIAARNVLVFKGDLVKLADFGMAKVLKDSDEIHVDNGKKLPIKWMPPESTNRLVFSLASDVWMFGVCIWEIASSGSKPFAEFTNEETASMVARGERLKCPESCPLSLHTIMLECWNADPSKRPKASVLKTQLRELMAQSKTSVPLAGRSSWIPKYSETMKAQGTQPTVRKPPANKPHSNWLIVTEIGDVGRLPSATPHQISGNNENTLATSTRMARENFRENTELRWHSTSDLYVKPNALRTSIPAEISSVRLSHPTDVDEDHDFLSFEQLRRHSGADPQIADPETMKCDEEFVRQARTSMNAKQKNRPESSVKSQNQHVTDVSQLHCKDSKMKSNRWQGVPGAEAIEQSEDGDEFQADDVYRATVEVVQAVRVIGKQLADVSPEHFEVLSQNLDGVVRALNVAVELTGCLSNEILLAKRQLVSSMSQFTAATKEGKLEDNSLMCEEVRRRLMSLAYVVANDAGVLYDVMYDFCHQRKNVV